MGQVGKASFRSPLKPKFFIFDVSNMGHSRCLKGCSKEDAWHDPQRIKYECFWVNQAFTLFSTAVLILRWNPYPLTDPLCVLHAISFGIPIPLLPALGLAPV